MHRGTATGLYRKLALPHRWMVPSLQVGHLFQGGLIPAKHICMQSLAHDLPAWFCALWLP